MIVYPYFIKCTAHTANTQLLYVLVKLSKSDKFIYKETALKSDEKVVSVSTSGVRSVKKISYSEMPYADFIDILSRIIDIGGEDSPCNTNMVVRDFMIHGYIVDLIRNGTIDTCTALNVYRCTKLASALKLIKHTDVVVNSDGRIVDITSIDVKNIDVMSLVKSIVSTRRSAATKKPVCMSDHWK